MPPAGWPLDRDPYHLESSVPGVFVAGDVRADSVKRVASAVGEGAMAVTLVHRYLEELMTGAVGRDELRGLFLFEALDDEQLAWLAAAGKPSRVRRRRQRLPRGRARRGPVRAARRARCGCPAWSGARTSSINRTDQRGVYAGAIQAYLDDRTRRTATAS